MKDCAFQVIKGATRVIAAFTLMLIAIKVCDDYQMTAWDSLTVVFCLTFAGMISEW